MLKYITTIWIWGLIFSAMLLHDFVFIITKWFSRNTIMLCCRLWYVILSWSFPLSGIRIVSKGLNHIPISGPYIIASTHQSIADIPILYSLVPPGFAFYAKKELSNVPIIGWNLKMMGCFLIDRSRPRLAIKDLELSRQKVEQGRSLLIFPEGTRSVDGQINPFKRGAFAVAVQTGVPVIPCVIDGSYKVVNKRNFWAFPGKVKVTFGTPILVKKVSKEQEKEASIKLMNQTREAIEKLRK